ncbi:MAG: hypothetical protein JWP89_7012 [Schlesneria sp.]|nr:hypothetical protein [Schlesneria sp.]
MTVSSPSPTSQSARLAEFTALRAEILLRIQLRSQLLAIAMSAFAGLFALSGNSAFPREILLIYPFLALFISHEWTYHDLRIRTIGGYIKSNIEPLIDGLGWQHSLDDTRAGRSYRLTSAGAGGVLVCGSVLTLAAALADYATLLGRYGSIIWLMVLSDLVAIGITLVLLNNRSEDTLSYKNRVCSQPEK